MPFGQVVFGPPGSGKTTYCGGMQEFMRATGRKVAVVNLDPANDHLPYLFIFISHNKFLNSITYECAIDISKLINLEKIMDTTELGPNGSFIYALEFLEANFEWLMKRLEPYKGQVELYTHHNSVKHIIEKLQQAGFRLAAVHLVDSFVCSQASTYVSAVLLSLSTMLQLELPHINVLSKIDLAYKTYGKFDFYTEVQDLSYLQQYLETDSSTKKFAKLNSALCELIEDFGLVGFQTLNIQDKESVAALIQYVDKATGYVYGAFTPGNESIFQVAESAINDFRILDVQEKYAKDDNDIEKLAQEWEKWE